MRALKNKTSFFKKIIETSMLIDFYYRADIWKLIHWSMEGEVDVVVMKVSDATWRVTIMLHPALAVGGSAF